MKADYTLKEAINMVEIICISHIEHCKRCEDCFASLEHREMDYSRCEGGIKMLDNYLKWQRRVGYAAKREGVKTRLGRTRR